jgi:5-methylcytosine-specific restriction endonuclease McrA
MGKEKRQYKDRREYLIRAVYIRRKKIRTKAVEHKGGCCKECGYSKCIDALEFHHIDPDQKDFTISSKGYTRSWEKVKSELDKCIILCANCHRELHAKLAASNRNVRVISGLSQGNPEPYGSGQS